MNGENNVEPINILISRDELLFVLNELEAEYIPGLDSDPMGELTNDQQTLALTVAERGLRARELARSQSNGEVELHTALLTMVGVCAYSLNVAFVYHYPANSDTPQRYFGHIRGDDVVAHARPDEAIHLFSLLPSKSILIDQILSVCEGGGQASTLPTEFTLPNQTFVAVREAAGSGDSEKAKQLLREKNVPSEAGEAFVDTLAGSPHISILQTVKQSDDGTLQKRDVTLLQNGNLAWLVIAPETSNDAPLQIKSSTSDELRSLLDAWL